MAFLSAVTGDDATRKFMEVLQNDFKTLSAETRKKYPQIREACDEAIEKLSLASNNPQASLYGVVNQILYPLVQGCESKDLKIIKFCLGTIQRLIAQQGIDTKGARHVVDCLYNLGQSATVELKLLQTAALLMTTSDLVHGDTLARTMVMCIRMVCASEARDASTSHAAAATVRQLVALVFERAQAEADGELRVNPAEVRQQPNVKAPKDLKPCAVDAYLILQDIIHLINGDAPNWLMGISDVPKTFGLELLDTVLTDFAPVFFKIAEFKFLLKEHVCALIIRLFSPNVKYRATASSPNIPGGARAAAAVSAERPQFPLSVRLLRLVAAILHRYHDVLVTECEIFLSLTIKFLDPDKPLWQRALALEVLHKMTIQPKLLSCFCACYDMKPHATNIFQDIVNALGAYVQSLFVASQINTQPGTQLAPSQPGFFWKGVWLPLCVTFEPGTAKSVYLEMLDRTEAPVIQDGYGISVAYACLMEIVRSIAVFVEGAESVRLQELYIDEQTDVDGKEVNSNVSTYKAIMRHSAGDTTKNGHDIADQNSNVTDTPSLNDIDTLKLQLIKSSWCGLVWGLSVLAEASAGQLDTILAAIQRLARCCGKMQHVSGRDACVSALCRCAVPGGGAGGAAGAWRREPPGAEPDCRHPVVWVGAAPPHPTAAGQQQSFVMVTSRHVTAMKALLLMARRDGDCLQQAWLPVLTSLQHLVWILGLKPSTGGSMKASRSSADANAVMSTSAVMADLPALSAMLSQVFEASRNLDDVALHHLIDALCKLSNEAMELAYSNREPSLFAVAKLLETGLANLHRIEVIWRPITNHLLEVCQHPHIRMREWGAEAITYLVQAAFQYLHDHPQQNTEARERLILEPLSALSDVPHCDVVSRQLECAARVLHSRGEQLRAAWPAICRLLLAAAKRPRAQIVRSAFQCAQLIAGDLLSACAPLALRRALAALAAFAAQHHDLNISLTAVGLMWNISDYLYHNRDKLTSSPEKEEAVFAELPQHGDLPYLDNMYMCLYIRLSELCCEPRAPVRRAASQTLFSCVAAHGPLLTPAGWRALLAVLCPALHQVQTLSAEASAEKVDTGEHILIHHTRNTAQKQWAETQVLMLSGVARVFHSRFQYLAGIGDFERSWATLLGFITDFSLKRSHEVSIAALKSFSSVISAAGRHCTHCESNGSRTGTPGQDQAMTGQSQVPSTNVQQVPPMDRALHDKVWGAAWRAWATIADQLKCIDTDQTEDGKILEEYSPSLGFLTSLVQIFPPIFHHIKTTFTPLDVETLGSCLSTVCSVVGVAAPLDSLTTVSPGGHAVHALQTVKQEALIRTELLPPLMCAFRAVSAAGGGGGGVAGEGGGRVACLAAAAETYVARPEPQLAGIVLQALHTAIKQCAESEARLRDPEVKAEAAQIAALLVQVLDTALPLAKEHPDHYLEFWNELPCVLECFMFQPPVGGGCSARQLVLSVVPHLRGGRQQRLLALLRRGARHTASCHDNDTELRDREEFARTCFESLLKLSMHDGDAPLAGDEDSDPLALMALLDRFEEVLRKYSQDHSATDHLPKHELSEISFTLKALATLAESMQKAPAERVDAAAWNKLIAVYPSLVRLCGGGGGGGRVGGGEAGAALRHALLTYTSLLTPPH